MPEHPEQPPRPQDPNQPILIPLKLDAFVFNKSVCDGTPPRSSLFDAREDLANLDLTGAKIAPIEQPNYTFLRLDSTLLQSDIQNPVDLYNSWPAEFNSRFTDLGAEKPKPHRDRIGVYLHWTLPRLFRSGVAAAGKEAVKSKSFAQQRQSRGLDPSTQHSSNDSTSTVPTDHSPPVFPYLPNRWLVIRHIPDPRDVLPKDAEIPEFSGWVVESDRLWDLKDLELTRDLQTDVSPFVAPGSSGTNGKDNTVSKQAEVFIGAKLELDKWKEKYIPKASLSTADDEPTAKFLEHFSLLTSSNQLFPDYQPHNSNVLSICDNFRCSDGTYLTKATAHYYVIGWYSEPQNDMFSGHLLDGPDGPITRKQMLDTLKLKIKLENPDGKQVSDEDVGKIFKAWLDVSQSTQTVCHGAMYEVLWDVSKKPDTVPADNFSTVLNSALPLAVGTTPLDAMTTYARAHTCLDPPEKPGKPDDKDKVTIPKLEKWITELERHLLARDDGVETQHQATDLLYSWNYARTDGGQTWNAAGMNENSKDPDRPGGTPTGLINILRDLNGQQIYLDAMKRAMTRLQRDIFSLWWRSVTDPTPEGKNDKTYAEQASKLTERFLQLKKKGDECETIINSKLDKKVMQPGARPAFYQQRDPTLLVGGIKSGWQYDFLDDLFVRIQDQLIGPEDVNTSDHLKVAETPWEKFENSFGEKFPSAIRSTIKGLFTEFRLLGPNGKPIKPRPTGKTSSPPLFHDSYSADNPRPSGVDTSKPNTADEPTALWRDRWNKSQPWFPLFLEWEVEYYHIPFETWDLAKRCSLTSILPQLRYGIPNTTDLSHRDPDRDPQPRRIQGRVLILPQPSFSLGAKIEQLFAGTPQPILDKKNDKGAYDYLSPEDRKSLQKNLHQLSFLSAPLAGLSAYLTTVLQGNHIKPNMRNGRTGALDPIKEALRPHAGLGEDQMKIIDIETDSTPFSFDIKAPVGTKDSLFKPVTHGQFRFTSLNIIDKFGQAIHAITPTAEDLAQPVWPCISEWYAPQLKADTKDPNVTDPRTPPTDSFIAGNPPKCPDPLPKPCEFVQLPPMINQSARLNASFVVRVGSEDESLSTNVPYSWRPADEWENPIWGWVLINYANQGIQLFTQDGTFYREVRFGGPNGTQSTPAWLPFRPPTAAALATAPASNGPETMQLQRLVARLGDQTFMRAFWEMIAQATDNMLPAPEAYGGFTNAALVGRPLALTQAGWSLELAADQLVSQAVRDNPITRTLLGASRDDHKKEDEDSDAENENPAQYAFKVKIGDTERGFDGLVGVFSCDKSLDPKTRTDLGLVLDTVYSDYLPRNGTPPKDKDGKQVIAPTRPLVLRPFYASPEQSSSAADYARRCNSHLSVRAVLVDPFSPIHAYSGLFPVRELELPPWTWQAALSKMKAFFHVGPLVLTKDVPAVFDASQELTPERPVTVPDVKHQEGCVRVPGIGKPDWVFLQPYYPDKDKKASTADVEPQSAEALERYMMLPTAVEEERARFEEGPYTMVEGYLLRAGQTTK